MRKQAVYCKSYATAQRRCSWAVKIVKISDGYIAFESIDDYKTWKNQK